MGKVLRDELADDPLGRGYVDMTDAEAATDINDVRISVRELVGVPGLNRHLLETGLWEKINKTAEQTDGSGNPSDAARAADMVLAVSVAPPASVDLDSDGVSGALNTLESADAITTDERSEIDALADDTISRAQQLGLGEVYEGHIYKARN